MQIACSPSGKPFTAKAKIKQKFNKPTKSRFMIRPASFMGCEDLKTNDTARSTVFCNTMDFWSTEKAQCQNPYKSIHQ